MRFMMLIIPKGYENAAPGAIPSPGSRRDDEVQRGTARGRCTAHAGWLTSAIGGQRVSFAGGKPSVTDGPFVETERGHRRLLDDQSEFEGGGHRLGFALPCVGHRNDRDSTGP